jgi:hypothetical protein
MSKVIVMPACTSPYLVPYTLWLDREYKRVRETEVDMWLVPRTQCNLQISLFYSVCYLQSIYWAPSVPLTGEGTGEVYISSLSPGPIDLVFLLLLLLLLVFHSTEDWTQGSTTWATPIVLWLLVHFLFFFPDLTFFIFWNGTIVHCTNHTYWWNK